MWVSEKVVKNREWAYNELIAVGYLSSVPDEPDQQGKKGFKVTFKGETVLNMLCNIMGLCLALQVDLDEEDI